MQLPDLARSKSKRHSVLQLQNIDWYEEQRNYGFWRANDLQMETAQKQFDFPTGINAL
jgi:hypothetical protein